MNEILRKRIEAEAENWMMSGAFEAGAEFALSHQWISVDEALPDDNEITLFIDQHGSMQLLTMNDIREQNKIRDAMLMGVSRDSLEESIVRLDKIIAWMPIPKFE